MSAISDKTIIENTHFREEGDDLICYTLLPNEDKFEQKVSSAEAVQKNMIGWCNTVREYLDVKEKQKEDAVLRARRDRELLKDAPSKEELEDKAPLESFSGSPKKLILQHFDYLQDTIDSLGVQIEQMKAERNKLRDERDQLAPIITVWRGE